MEDILVAEELEREKRKNRIIQEFSLTIHQLAPLKDKLDRILLTLESNFQLRHSMLLLPVPDTDKLKVFASHGFDNDGLGAEIKIGEGVIGIVAQRKKKLRMVAISRQRQYVKAAGNANTDEVLPPLPGLPDAESQLAIPLLNNDELLAVLSVESPDVNFFSHEDEEFLLTLSQLMAISIQNALIHEQLELKVKERTKEIEDQKLELEQLNFSKDRLFSIIGHDLRGPASALQNLADLVCYYHNKGDLMGLTQLTAKIGSAAQNINMLLDNLLNWSVTQTGEINLQPEKLMLRPLVGEVLHLYEELIETKKIQITIGGDPFTTIKADRNAALCILRNIISNAIKFTLPGGAVNINIKEDGSFTTVTVTDTGLGIPEDKCAAIFELTHKKCRKGTLNEKGSGIGLLLVKEFVQHSAGRITVSSKPGEGTTVKISLPAA